ncbi:hypothetical protein [Flavobacterium sp.]|uniref:hypothetical protein n=1 Tax=Flavobacterium sp. TaxID=239 RepID=UPI003B9A0A0B
MKKYLIFLIAGTVLTGCVNSSKPEKVIHAFYQWKAEGDFDHPEFAVLDTFNVKKVYYRFFDVEHSPTMGNIPTSKTNRRYGYRYYQENDLEYELVPTVFIRNEVFLQSSKADIDILVSNVNHLIKKYCAEGFSDFKTPTEIQIDCDWTIRSKANYFYFLEEFKKASQKNLSCTLRLYPYKYRTKMGIPPVDKVVLMCYNLLPPLENPKRNSILEPDELRAYLTVDEPYPIHLDVALPVFQWAFHYRYDTFKGFTTTTKESLISFAERKSELWWEVKKDTSINEVYYRTGDRIKFETVSYTDLKKSVALLKKNVKFPKETTVILFDLDTTLFHEYSKQSIDKLLHSFTE